MRDYVGEAVHLSLGSDPPMRTATLFHAARAVALTDATRGARLFDEGLAEFDTLDARSRSDLASRALLFGAAVAPRRVKMLIETLPFRQGRIRDHMVQDVVQRMLEHGHVSQAAGFQSESGTAANQAFRLMGIALMRVGEASSLRILRGAVQAWRDSPSDEFLPVFQEHWTLFPVDEARSVVRELLAFVLSQPDRQVHASLPAGRGVAEFEWQKDWCLFRILNALRQLEPELADTLIHSREELGRAAAMLPPGLDSLENSVKAGSDHRVSGGGFGYAGSGEGLSAARIRFEADRAGDIDSLIEDALRTYHQDTDVRSPNRATRACWPSMVAFNHALYIAGRMHGIASAGYLERVPALLRPLPQIEFVAGIHGLAEMRLPLISFHPPSQGRHAVE